MMLHPDTATRSLREAGLRLTPQRRAVIDVLAGDTSHPLAEDVARRVSDRMPGVSLSTVYKTLHEFAALGLVRELGLPGAMRFDPNSSPHAHLMCDSCNTVVDVPLPPETYDALVASAEGARLDLVEITLRGHCRACSAS